MDHKYFSLIDMAIVGVPVLGLCAWQLVSITREIARDRKADDSPESARHPIGEHRLDDR